MQVVFDDETEVLQLLYSLVVAKYQSEKASDICSFPWVDGLIDSVERHELGDASIARAVRRYYGERCYEVISHQVGVLADWFGRRSVADDEAIEMARRACRPYAVTDAQAARPVSDARALRQRLLEEDD